MSASTSRIIDTLNSWNLYKLVRLVRSSGSWHSGILCTLLASLQKLCLFWYPKPAPGFSCEWAAAVSAQSKPLQNSSQAFQPSSSLLEVGPGEPCCFAMVQETFLMRNCLSVTWDWFKCSDPSRTLSKKLHCVSKEQANLWGYLLLEESWETGSPRSILL